MPATAKRQQYPDFEILANLRLWSDELPLDSVAQDLGLKPKHLQYKGEVIPVRASPPSHRVVDCYYFSSEGDRMCAYSEIEGWLHRELARVEAVPSVARLLRNRMIKPCWWIYIGGGRRGEIPCIAPALGERAAALGGEVYVEHWYDDPVPGGTWPEKAWFPAPPKPKDAA